MCMKFIAAATYVGDLFEKSINLQLTFSVATQNRKLYASSTRFQHIATDCATKPSVAE